MTLLEQTILRQLMASQAFAEQVTPYLKQEYFPTNSCATLYTVFLEFFEKYRQLPSFTAVRLGVDNQHDLSEGALKEALSALTQVEASDALNEETQSDYLLKETEKFCQDRALYCALRKSVSMLDDPKASPHAIPDLLKEALGVSFDTHVGHDFFAQAEQRYDFYHQAESRIPFDLNIFNDMTKGGVPSKTLNIVLAGTNVGKSLFLVHLAAACLRMSKKVLYVTLEMAEERIAERIDANMLDIPMDDLIALPRERYLKKLNTLQQTSTGRVIIKEYPTATAHTGHFRALLHELKMKQNFKPDILFVDYISICASARIKMGNAINSYTYNKFIAEELRGLAVEQNIPVWTAAQFNRQGFASSDPDLSNVGESFGIPQTADFMLALTTSEELERNNQIQAYVLKNRYAKRNSFQKFVLGVDTSRMKLYETNLNGATGENAAQQSAGFPKDFNMLPASEGIRRMASRRKPLTHLKTTED